MFFFPGVFLRQKWRASVHKNVRRKENSASSEEDGVDLGVPRTIFHTGIIGTIGDYTKTAHLGNERGKKKKYGALAVLNAGKQNLQRQRAKANAPPP